MLYIGIALLLIAFLAAGVGIGLVTSIAIVGLIFAAIGLIRRERL